MWYTYLYLREDGTPYYVGKGTRYRITQRSSRKVSVPSTDRIIIQEFDKESEALAAEVFLIEFYGRNDMGCGCLRNHTDGGEGISGHTHSQETRQRISQSRKGKNGFIPPRLTHCAHGHEMTLENVYVRSDGRRSCKSCQNTRCRDYRNRKRL